MGRGVVVCVGGGGLAAKQAPAPVHEIAAPVFFTNAVHHAYPAYGYAAYPYAAHHAVNYAAPYAAHHAVNYAAPYAYNYAPYAYNYAPFPFPYMAAAAPAAVEAEE